jgi:hypothetical protein
MRAPLVLARGPSRFPPVGRAVKLRCPDPAPRAIGLGLSGEVGGGMRPRLEILAVGDRLAAPDHLKVHIGVAGPAERQGPAVPVSGIVSRRLADQIPAADELDQDSASSGPAPGCLPVGLRAGLVCFGRVEALQPDSPTAGCAA